MNEYLPLERALSDKLDSFARSHSMKVRLRIFRHVALHLIEAHFATTELAKLVEDVRKHIDRDYSDLSLSERLQIGGATEDTSLDLELLVKAGPHTSVTSDNCEAMDEFFYESMYVFKDLDYSPGQAVAILDECEQRALN